MNNQAQLNMLLAIYYTEKKMKNRKKEEKKI